MGTTTSIDRQRAVAWLVQQMAWERTLDALRTGAAQGTEERAAA